MCYVVSANEMLNIQCYVEWTFHLSDDNEKGHVYGEEGSFPPARVPDVSEKGRIYTL
jgi:hypothetical protein